jgi:hypothetical protein
VLVGLLALLVPTPVALGLPCFFADDALDEDDDALAGVDSFDSCRLISSSSFQASKRAALAVD